jgi:hypothetical protein
VPIPAGYTWQMGEREICFFLSAISGEFFSFIGKYKMLILSANIM